MNLTRREVFGRLLGGSLCGIGLAAAAPLVKASRSSSATINWIIPARVFERLDGPRGRNMNLVIRMIQQQMPKGHKLFRPADGKLFLESRDHSGSLRAEFVVITHDPRAIDKRSGDFSAADRQVLTISGYPARPAISFQPEVLANAA